MIFVIKLKKRVTGADIFSIIISNFRHNKKPYSIILFKIDKDLETSFHHAILGFNLAINLQVKCDEDFLLNA